MSNAEHANNIKKLQTRLPLWIKRNAIIPADYTELGKLFDITHAITTQGVTQAEDQMENDICNRQIRCSTWVYFRSNLVEIAGGDVNPYLDVTSHGGILKAILIKSQASKGTNTHDVLRTILNACKSSFEEGDAMLRRIWNPIMPGIREILGYGREPKIEDYQWPLDLVKAIKDREGVAC